MSATVVQSPGRRRAVFAVAALTLAVGAWATCPTGARADNLDVALLEQAPKVMDYLHKQGYKNVGVLPFRLQKGTKGQPEFNVGELNTNMATRLENLMVLLVDPNDPMGIITDAGHAALTRSRSATYLTTNGRKSLFDQSYALVWGQTQVKPDAFVTGDIILSPDNKTCTVIVKAFDKKGGELKKVEQFTVKTDRSILGDAGQSFALARGMVKKRGPEQDDAAAESATKKDQGQDPTDTQPTNPGQPTPGQGTADQPVTLTIMYDGQPAGTEPDPDSPGSRRVKLRRARGPGTTESSVAGPKENQKVTLVLQNTGSEQMAVVLKVNGMNTIYQETQDAINCTKWVLDPTKKYEIRGFYTEQTGDNLLAFKVLSDDESKQKADEMKDNASFGCIEMYVFRSGNGGPVDTEEMQISRHASFRGVRKEIMPKGQAAPRNVKEAQSLYAKHFPIQHQGGKLQLDRAAVKSRSASKSRNVIGSSGSAEKGGDLKETQFANASEVYSLKYRYFTAGQQGTGQPGTGQPGTGQPGTGQPGTGQPGTGQPGTGQPGKGQPGTGQPGTGQPGTGQPGTGQPGKGQPGTGQPGTGQPGTGQPGTGQPGTGQPGKGQPGTGQPGTGQPVKNQPPQ